MSTENAAEFRWPVRVYYEDTDAAGVVYYANYLKFFERCRTEWLRSIGYEQRAIGHDEQAAFVVAQLQVDYIRPARLDDALTITATVTEQKGATLLFAQRAVCVATDTEHLLASAQVKIACIHPQSLKPRALPRSLLEAMRDTLSDTY